MTIFPHGLGCSAEISVVSLILTLALRRATKTKYPRPVSSIGVFLARFYYIYSVSIRYILRTTNLVLTRCGNAVTCCISH
jgi:hypothetical protein